MKLKQGLAYFVVSVDFFEHPVIRTLSASEQVAYLKMIAYSAKYRTDGVLPKSVVSKSKVDALLIQKLIKCESNVIEVCGYLDWQISSHEIEENRRKTRERAKNFRKRNVVSNDVSNATRVEKSREEEIRDPESSDKSSDSRSLVDLAVDQDVEPIQKKPRRPAATNHPDVVDVFNFWVETWQEFVGAGSARLLLSQKRAAKVLARLSDGYTSQQIRNAVIGAFSSPYHRENGFLDLELICRDPQHLDQFLVRYDRGMRELSAEPSQQADRESEARPIPGNLWLLNGGKG